MKVVVVDLEANQPSGNIIQIGAVQLDCRTGVIDNHFSVFIKLPESDPLSPDITVLTAITAEQLASGLPLKEALDLFWAYVGKKTLCSWGRDYWDLIKATRSLGEEPPNMGRMRTIDLKAWSQVFACVYPANKAKGGGLARMMEMFQVPFVGRAHDGLVDAENTARLMWRWISAFGAAENALRVFEKSTSIQVNPMS